MTMADFQKRPEITISTMGRVHNPSGEGVRAVSNNVKKRTINQNSKVHSIHNEPVDHETKVKDVGSSRRNITRKKGGNEQLYNNKNKKQGGAG